MCIMCPFSVCNGSVTALSLGAWFFSSSYSDLWKYGGHRITTHLGFPLLWDSDVIHCSVHVMCPSLCLMHRGLESVTMLPREPRSLSQVLKTHALSSECSQFKPWCFCLDNDHHISIPLNLPTWIQCVTKTLKWETQKMYMWRKLTTLRFIHLM